MTDIGKPVGEIIAAFILARMDSAPAVIGLCGPQGSGKSTACAAAIDLLAREGVAAALVSLDDFYLGKARREELGRTVHPLMTTRGPPGTHDVAVLEAALADLVGRKRIVIPRFDKVDDDIAESAPTVSVGPADVVILEGWCVGATPQTEAALAAPINRLEAECDRDASWRSHVNAQLAGPYRSLFARVEYQILLQAPSFEVVRRWRLEQEATNLRDLSGRNAMCGLDVSEFIQYFERITRNILSEMPGRADLVITIDEDRKIVAA